MNSLAVSLDTNILLRLLLNDVPSQHKAAVELFKSKSGQFAIADVAVMDIR